MSEESRVFLVSPDKVIVYSIHINSDYSGIYYNAGSLNRIDNLEIESYEEVKGVVTPKFGVNPIVFGYSDGTLELVYIVGDKVLLSDGSPAKAEKEVESNTTLLVPNLEYLSYNQKQIVPLNLEEPNFSVMMNFIENSGPLMSPKSNFRSPTPRISAKEIENSLRSSSKIEKLEEKINELYDIVKVMNQRLYRIYPVMMPKHFQINEEKVPILPLSTIQEKINNNEIERFTLEPTLQAYAGSHHSNNRMILCHDKSGETYLVRAEYDAKRNKVNTAK